MPTITVFIKKKQYDELLRLAERAKKSIGQIIREALDFYIRQLSKEVR